MGWVLNMVGELWQVDYNNVGWLSQFQKQRLAKFKSLLDDFLSEPSYTTWSTLDPMRAWYGFLKFSEEAVVINENLAAERKRPKFNSYETETYLGPSAYKSGTNPYSHCTLLAEGVQIGEVSPTNGLIPNPKPDKKRRPSDQSEASLGAVRVVQPDPIQAQIPPAPAGFFVNMATGADARRSSLRFGNLSQQATTVGNQTQASSSSSRQATSSRPPIAPLTFSIPVSTTPEPPPQRPATQLRRLSFTAGSQDTNEAPAPKLRRLTFN